MSFFKHLVRVVGFYDYREELQYSRDTLFSLQELINVQFTSLPGGIVCMWLDHIAVDLIGKMGVASRCFENLG